MTPSAEPSFLPSSGPSASPTSGPSYAPTVVPTAYYVCGTPVPVDPSECPVDGDIAPCDAVACGQLCDGDGECDTDDVLDNCGTFDIYRKRCFWTGAPTATPMPSAAPTAAPSTFYVQESLVVYSRLHGYAGDDSGHGNSGYTSGAWTTIGRDGDYALGFNGWDYVSFPADVTRNITGDAARTVCVWARIDSFNEGTLFFYGSASAPFALRTTSTSNVVRLEYASGVYSDNYVADAYDWRHYCATYDGSTLNLYVDAALAATVGAALATGTDYHLYLGVYTYPTGFFYGALDELFVYARALDAAEVERLYDAHTSVPTGAPTQGPLVADYYFSWGAATTSFGAGSRDGTVTGAVEATGRDGSHALYFDGTDDSVAFPTTVTEDILGGAARSACLWAQLDSFDDPTYLFYYGSNADGGTFGLQWVDNSTLRLQFYGAADHDLALAADSYWHHYCLTYDGTTATFYYDGYSVASATVALDTGADVALTLGSAEGTANFVEGRVDEFKVYRDALESWEVYNLFWSYGSSVATYYFSYGAGTASAYYNDGTLDGTVHGGVEKPGRDGSGALHLDGTDDYVAFDAAVTADLLGSNPRTFALWAQLDRVEGTYVFYYGSNADGRSFGLQWVDNSTMRLEFYGAADHDLALTVDDDWHHYALSYDGTSAAFYLDGAVEMTVAVALDTGADVDLCLGAAEGTQHFVDGRVDQFAVYRRALETWEVWNLFAYYGTVSPTPAPTPAPTEHCHEIAWSKRVVSAAVSHGSFVDAVDVDGDGDVDVLSAAQGTGQIAWHENDYWQNFYTTVIDGAAPNATSVRAVDVDSDGDVDMVATSGGDDSVAWHENDGYWNPSFTTHDVGTGAWPVGVYAVDVDDDGDVDVLTADRDADSLYVYANDAESFTRHAVRAGGLSAPRFVYAIDVDGDATVDVVSAVEGSDRVAWHEHDGAFGFTEHVVSALAGPRGVHAMDVDGDADVDVLGAWADADAVAWYANDGSQSFSLRTVTASLVAPRSIVACDVDGDGDVDVVTASPGDDLVAWHENDGAQTFALRAVANASGSAPVYALAIDVDGDGDKDVVAVHRGADEVAWYENNCMPAPTAVPSAPTYMPTPVPTTAAPSYFSGVF